jgi:hypothetical protein
LQCIGTFLPTNPAAVHAGPSNRFHPVSVSVTERFISPVIF